MWHCLMQGLKEGLLRSLAIAHTSCLSHATGPSSAAPRYPSGSGFPEAARPAAAVQEERLNGMTPLMTTIDQAARHCALDDRAPAPA